MNSRFDDLRSAGRELAVAMEEFAGRDRTVVLGLVRGGVPVSVEVAAHLAMPLDVVVIVRLLAPRGPEDPIGAASVAGRLVFDEELPAVANPPRSGLDFHLSGRIAALEETTRLCRGGREPLDIAGTTVLLVDNGARSGKTIRAAIRAIRRRHPARVIAALPAAAPEARGVLEASADEVVCLRWPSPYGNVAMWYSRFDVPNIDETCAMVFDGAVRRSTTGR